MASFKEINIPQKPPMVMVDRIVEMDGLTTTTSFVIRENNIFTEDGLFREPGLIENMAQSSACSAGAKPGITEAPRGFIGGIRNLVINSFPGVGDEIFTKVTVLHEVFEATVVQGEVFCNGSTVASCELKIFLIKG
jgi:3-hydroxymyristoyl/3-hydroxydecanoyl-(acyl carrier protein) dehydratase